MESDLHVIIKANDDLTPEHHQFFLYLLLRGLKYIHSGNVFHRDLKPQNILANSDSKLKICDFGLARVITWQLDGTELLNSGSFLSKYTPAIDMWSMGCIFAEIITRNPLFPGKSVFHQLDLMTDLLGNPSPDVIDRIRNEKARSYLGRMQRKKPVPLSQKFPHLHLLERMLAFDPKDRPTAEEALADHYFNTLADVANEPSTQPISKLEFEFERRKLSKDDILKYHPQMLDEYLPGGEPTTFMYPSGVERLRSQFNHLEQFGGVSRTPLQRQHASLPRERVLPEAEGLDEPTASTSNVQILSEASGSYCSARSLLKSAIISASKCIGDQNNQVRVIFALVSLDHDPLLESHSDHIYIQQEDEIEDDSDDLLAKETTLWHFH
ncbi:hypothetical protein V2J09_019409 [Rumex salicifolius]